MLIPLDPARETVVGRYSSSADGVNYVFLNSERLPFMLSTKHASLSYNKEPRKWLIVDLKVELCGTVPCTTRERSTSTHSGHILSGLSQIKVWGHLHSSITIEVCGEGWAHHRHGLQSLAS